MLTYDLIPAQETESKRLLIALHGLGDSMEGYRWLPVECRLSRMNYLLVNAPDSYYGGYSWYDIYDDPGPGIVRSREKLFELFDEVQRLGFSIADTVLFGFSQGCLMTMEAGLRYPKTFAALIGVSGYFFEPERLIQEWADPARNTRVLITHGRRDPLIPIDKVRQQVETVKAAGLNVQWREFDKDHTIAGAEEIHLIREFIEQSYGK